MPTPTAARLKAFRLKRDKSSSYPHRVFVRWNAVISITDASVSATLISAVPPLRQGDSISGSGIATGATIGAITGLNITLSAVASNTIATNTVQITREVLQSNGSRPWVQTLSEQDRLLITDGRSVDPTYRVFINQSESLLPIIRTDIQWLIQFAPSPDKAKMRSIAPVKQDARQTLWQVFLEKE